MQVEHYAFYTISDVFTTKPVVEKGHKILLHVVVVRKYDLKAALRENVWRGDD